MKRFSGAILLLLLCSPLFGQQLKELQFVNQPITDILLALGEVSGKSIVPDETVAGAASYRFVQTDFDTALQSFLSTYKMYLRREGEVHYVSRIRTEFDPQSQSISMDAEEVDAHFLLRAASKAIGKTVLFDPLPTLPLTVHVSRPAPRQAAGDHRQATRRLPAGERSELLLRETSARQAPGSRLRQGGAGAGQDRAARRVLLRGDRKGEVPAHPRRAVPEGRARILAVVPQGHDHRKAAFREQELRAGPAPGPGAGQRRLRPGGQRLLRVRDPEPRRAEEAQHHGASAPVSPLRPGDSPACCRPTTWLRSISRSTPSATPSS